MLGLVFSTCLKITEHIQTVTSWTYCALLEQLKSVEQNVNVSILKLKYTRMFSLQW